MTVTISVGRNTVFARSALRIQGKGEGGEMYLVDTGKRIQVKEGEGIVDLARKMLNTIQEPRKRHEVQDTRTYYRNREEAEAVKHPGDRIYYSEDRGFWVTTPKRRVTGSKS
ncbi:MAG: hypothetical protein QMD46_07455 [Methanomicrobiales archaeon]|nr:hypothetical protein [Methanomicrobiales archaeon]